MQIIYINSPKYGTHECLVDDSDYEYLSQISWHLSKGANTFYARENKKKDKRKSMHRLILQLSDPKIFVDHIDHNGLNNQRSNLREVTSSQNMMNKRKPSNKISKYKGVFGVKTNNKRKVSKVYRWYAQITINNKRKHLGSFPSEAEAAKAYNQEAIILFGEFAYLNKIE